MILPVTIFFTLTVVLLILIALWNGYVILWRTDQNNDITYSKIWHIIGLGTRVLIYFLPLMVYYITNSLSLTNALKWTALFISVGGILYDIIINVIRYKYLKAPPLNYIDNKGWNAYFLKIFGYVSKLITNKFKKTITAANLYWYFRISFILLTIIIFII